MSDHEENAPVGNPPSDMIEASELAQDEVRPFDDGDDSQLSDLDDEIFADYNDGISGSKSAEEQEQVPIDEDTVTTLGKYKKKGTAKAIVGDAAAKAGKRRRRDKSARHEEEEDEVVQPVIEKPLTEEERRRQELDRKMDEALKGPKKKKRRKNDHDLERMDDEAVENLRLAMLEAAKCDTEAIENGQPATHKLAMVDQVRDMLNRQNLISVAVDCGILKGIRRWLEPLPNKSLPAYNVQKLMFEVLAKLKPDFTHLQESGIGKIVMFYTKDARPERHIKREAEKLVRDWSRPILGRSDDYRSKDIPIADGSRPLPTTRRPHKDSNAPNPLAAPARDTGRARAMIPTAQSYDIAPKDRIIPGNKKFSKPMNAEADDFIRKLKAKKAKKGVKGPA